MALCRVDGSLQAETILLLRLQTGTMQIQVVSLADNSWKGSQASSLQQETHGIS